MAIGPIFDLSRYQDDDRLAAFASVKDKEALLSCGFVTPSSVSSLGVIQGLLLGEEHLVEGLLVALEYLVDKNEHKLVP